MVTLENKQKIFKILYILGLTVLIAVGLVLRLIIFDKAGGDYSTYKDAMVLFHKGENPYYETVQSFKSLEGEHGYAYFPTLLYIQYGVWMLNNFTGIIVSTIILWKIPVLIADLLIVYLILKNLGKPEKISDYLYRLASVFVWFINPYLIARYDYALYDPLFLLFLFLAIDKLDKNSWWAGVFYALSVSLKTIPLILFPLFLTKTPNKIKFLLAGVLIFVLMSLPFMKSVDNFNTYLQGAFFVHSERGIQGRPLISLLTYRFQDFGISMMQHEFERIYAALALILSLTIPTILFYATKLNNKFSWTVLAFGIYLALTPVLSRTHVLWLLPWLCVFIYQFFKSKNKLKLAPIALLLVWFVSFSYLFVWGNGFEVKPDKNNKTHLVLNKSKAEWELTRVLRHQYYSLRGKLQK